ncbi:TPA: TIGR03752 family integrating conjugative element protein [Proteus mirabilis]|uniref:TIGR03752 family integrating conjugative element protein n=1 Tax=Proteus mirabilis TaxID=584 RepID=UPI00189F9EEF|nr:TIGR03752 family integrating conjugative element protein [Proteus mirabilis]EKW4025145.1 TIGR03752 family integrating conjugative element protein [Proteus mirabilis]EKW4662441.1 TIGR03752 family integrating conjugative element protein [Proteus mirabilis]ELB1686362.1 TIGR03752 family integrating conjugative element protein [Proteus mirabilis]HDU8345541.1 TIGR03752 family integrating conjugative element protein [Proteus mirabilis]
MQISSNILLKIIVPVVLLVVIMVSVKSCDHTQSARETTHHSSITDLTQEELRILGIEGDTAQDTLRTLLGRMKAIQINQEKLERQSKALLTENTQLKNRSDNVESRIHEAVTKAQEEGNLAQQTLYHEQQRLADLLDILINEQQNIKAKETELPVGLALEQTDQQTTVWIDPLEGIVYENNAKPVNGTSTFQYPTSFRQLEDNEISRQKAKLDLTAKKQQHIQATEHPVYTLPENATLMGSQAMTALLGRVPIDGKVTDPYPFKILIGKENLTANGIELPDVEGAVVSGTATGDWVLSCVRGDIHSITFVFEDGSIRTVPKSATSTDGRHDKSQGGSIGWLSDEQGVPCLSGTRKSNASTYLPTLFALSASSAASSMMAESQTTKATDGLSVMNSLTGNAGKAVLGKALSGGSNEIAEWVKARYGQMFDAIYVPPGAPVAVHITRAIPIDYEAQGRKVKYDFDISQQNELD